MSTIEELTQENSAAWADLVVARLAAKGKPDDSDEAAAKKAATERHATTKKALEDAKAKMKEDKAAAKIVKDAEKAEKAAAKAEKEAAKAEKSSSEDEGAKPKTKKKLGRRTKTEAPDVEDTDEELPKEVRPVTPPPAATEVPDAPKKGKRAAKGGAGGG